MDHLNAEMKRADLRVAQAFAESHQAQLLATIPGVGPVFALTIASEIDDIDRFHSAKHVSSYAGLVPSTSQSGAHAWHGKITRQGSAWLRWALMESVIHTVRYQSPIKDSYVRLKKRKGNKIARVAAARKLCTYIYHMLKEDKDYDSVVSFLKSDLG
jgi:transposase